MAPQKLKSNGFLQFNAFPSVGLKWSNGRQSDDEDEDVQEGSLNGSGEMARLNLEEEEEEILTSFSSLLHFPENKAEQGSLWRSLTGTRKDFVVEPTPATWPERQFVYVNIHYILFILSSQWNWIPASARVSAIPSFDLPHSLSLFFSPSFSRPQSSHFGCASRQPASQPASQNFSFHGNRRSPPQIIIIPTTTSNYISVKLICKFLC